MGKRSEQGWIRRALKTLRRLFRPEKPGPEDPYAYVTAPKKPGPPRRSASVAEEPER